MEDLEKLFAEKNITASSKNLYLKNLVRLNSGNEIKNFNFLKNEKEIQEKLEKYKPNTQRTYIISIVSLLKELSTKEPRKYKKLYDKYFILLDKFNKDLKTNNDKSIREQENWISQADVLSKLEDLKHILPKIADAKKINEDQFNELQKLLILSLYALQKPRRNKDYQDNLIYKKIPVPFPEGHNILDLAGNRFIFQNFKTQKKYPLQEIPIVPELREIIDVYLKFHPTYKKSQKEPVQFLVTYGGVPYENNNDMTRLLYRIFNKKIGCSMLRHIYLTDKYKDVLNDMKSDAEQMGTSENMVQNQYVKN
jgi:hypothetical protein